MYTPHVCSFIGAMSSLNRLSLTGRGEDPKRCVEDDGVESTIVSSGLILPSGILINPVGICRIFAKVCHLIWKYMRISRDIRKNTIGGASSFGAASMSSIAFIAGDGKFSNEKGKHDCNNRTQSESRLHAIFKRAASAITGAGRGSEIL
ncbi:hypothetical protein [Shinella sp. JR1-6]|nr:hypothetical protein [Shinella sp. JR1-6]